MLKTYFRIAWRNLVRNKTLSFINIFGLALGMTFAILIGMWIYYQYSFDDFNVNKDRIAAAGRNMAINGEKATAMNVMLPLYDELKDHYPAIKRITRMQGGGKHTLTVGNNAFSRSRYFVDPAFLQMFTFPAVYGNLKTALDDPNSIVLTESVATALFGPGDPTGKMVTLDNQYNLQVSAVVKDVPKNSSITFEILQPFQFKIQNEEDTRASLTRWNNNFLNIIVEIREGVALNDLNKTLSPLLKSKNTGMKVETLFLYPMTRWNLWGDFKDWIEIGTQIVYIRLFGIIGLFILLIACINFMNLSTARSERRALEVGIRKTVGSSRGQLIAQFLIESMVTALLAFALTLIMIQLLLPLLKDIGFENIHFNWSNLPLITSALAICLLTGLIAGSYPAFYLSHFHPVQVLKSKIKQGWQAVNLRKILVVTQFTTSIALIICTVIVMGQIEHARSRSMGYDPNNLITLDARANLLKNYDALKQDLLNTGRVAAVTKASSSMDYINNDFGNWSWTGKDPHADIFIKTVMIDFDYEQTARLQLVAGRFFSQQFKTDSNAVILNQAAVDLIGYKDPIGKTMDFDRPMTIIGITKNVVMENPFKPVPPEIFYLNPGGANTILLRLKDQADLKPTLAALQPIFEKYNPASAWEYHFADEEFEKKFATENQIAKLAGIFAVLAVVISCLGLFGLAMFMAERRSKEVSIRKVLGASIANIWLLLSREFIWLVGIASVIAAPIAIWVMSDWLKNYEYRIKIHWWIPVTAGLLAMLIALLTVSAQAIKAASVNPAKNLKTE